MKKLLIGLILLAALKASFSIEAIITTNLTYPDTIVGSVVSEIYGYPLIQINKDGYSSLVNDLQEANITKVYILGGVAVISGNVEREIVNAGIDVVRIAGYTRFGTSYLVAKYFFGSSNEVIVAIDYPDGIEKENETVATEQVEMLDKAKEMAIEKEIPLILAPAGKVSKSLEDTLEALNVSKIYLVGTVKKEVIDELSEKYEVEHVAGDELENVYLNRSCKRLLVIGLKNWKYFVTYPLTNTCVRIVTEKNYNKTIEKIKEEIQEKNISLAIVRGHPGMVSKICDELSNITTTDCVIKPIPKVIKKKINEIKNQIQEKLQKIEKLKNKVKKNAQKLLKICKERIENINTTIEKIKLVNSDFNESEIRELVDQYYEAEGKPLKRLAICYKIKSKLIEAYKKSNLTEEIQSQIKNEIENKKVIKDAVVSKISKIKKVLTGSKILKECLAEKNLTVAKLKEKNLTELKEIVNDLEKCYIEKAKNKTIKKLIKPLIISKVQKAKGK